MASRQGLHILLVECDSGVMNVTTSILEHMGYTVHGETNGLAALSTFSHDPDKFDLAIIEPVMPKLMGLELALHLVRIRQDFPVLFYAGYLDLDLEQAIGDSGVGPTIFKPLMSWQLEEAIQQRVCRVYPLIR